MSLILLVLLAAWTATRLCTLLLELSGRGDLAESAARLHAPLARWVDMPLAVAVLGLVTARSFAPHTDATHWTVFGLAVAAVVANLLANAKVFARARMVRPGGNPADFFPAGRFVMVMEVVGLGLTGGAFGVEMARALNAH